MKKMRSKLTKALPPKPADDATNGVRPSRSDLGETREDDMSSRRTVSSTTSTLAPVHYPSQSSLPTDDIARLRKELDMATSFARRNLDIGNKLRQELSICRTELSALQADFIAMRALLPSNVDMSEAVMMLRTLKQDLGSLRSEIKGLRDMAGTKPTDHGGEIADSPTAVSDKICPEQDTLQNGHAQANAPLARFATSSSPLQSLESVLTVRAEERRGSSGPSTATSRCPSDKSRCFPSMSGRDSSRMHQSISSQASTTMSTLSSMSDSQFSALVEATSPAASQRIEYKPFPPSPRLAAKAIVSSGRRDAIRVLPTDASKSVMNLCLPPLPPRSAKLVVKNVVGPSVAETKQMTGLHSSSNAQIRNRRRSKSFSGQSQALHPALQRNAKVSKGDECLGNIKDVDFPSASDEALQMSDPRALATRASQTESSLQAKSKSRAFTPEPVFSVAPLKPVHSTAQRGPSPSAVSNMERVCNEPEKSDSPVAEGRTESEILADEIRQAIAPKSSTTSVDEEGSEIVLQARQSSSPRLAAIVSIKTASDDLVQSAIPVSACSEDTITSPVSHQKTCGDSQRTSLNVTEDALKQLSFTPKPPIDFDPLDKPMTGSTSDELPKLSLDFGFEPLF